MKKHFLAIILFTFSAVGFSTISQAQSVTINPSTTSPLIDASSTTKGVVIPRMTFNERNLLTLTQGLQVYCKDCSPAGPYSYDGTTWIPMFSTAAVTVPTYTIGQAAQGGIIFWLDGTSQHGLAAATVDQNVGVQWYNGTHTNTKAVSEGVYGGFFNTDRITINQANGTYAALVCASYSDALFGFGDWYLPSKAELNFLYAQRTNIPALNLNLSSYYWSSTEFLVSMPSASDSAWAQYFGNGSQVATTKNTPYRVRAIRRF